MDCIGDDCSGPPQNVKVERIIPHEDYDPADSHQQNDIALLRLEHNVQFNGEGTLSILRGRIGTLPFEQKVTSSEGCV